MSSYRPNETDNECYAYANVSDQLEMNTILNSFKINIFLKSKSQFGIYYDRCVFYNIKQVHCHNGYIYHKL
jgi:hypothetical protein